MKVESTHMFGMHALSWDKLSSFQKLDEMTQDCPKVNWNCAAS